MSALLDRIRFLAKNPEVGVQHFSTAEAVEFLAEYEVKVKEPLLTLSSLADLGTACPSQWEAMTTLGERAFIRYRHGMLTVTMYDEDRLGDSRYTIYAEKVGDDMDGVMDTDEMLGHTGIVVSDT